MDSSGIYPAEGYVSRWVAVQITPAGQKVIAQTPPRRAPGTNEFKKGLFGGIDMKKYDAVNKRNREEFESDRRRLLAQLIANGWEPLETDNYGKVVLMKR